MDEKDKPTPEEIQVDEIIKEATKRYGELEDWIKDVPNDAGPSPRYVPAPGGVDNKKYNHHAKRVEYFRNSQQEVIEKVKTDVEEISKNCPLDIQNKINEKVDAWKKSDIHDSYLHGKEKSIDEASERYFKVHGDSKIRRGREEVDNASERATKLIDDFREKQASIAKAKEFAVNKRDALTKEEPSIETAKEDNASRSDLPDFLTRDYSSLPDKDTKEKTQDKDDFEKDKD